MHGKADLDKPIMPPPRGPPCRPPAQRSPGRHPFGILDACVALHTLLRRKPWQTDVVDTLGQDTPPSYEVNKEDWRAARQIRIELERAAKA
jgi:hypothetical protein